VPDLTKLLAAEARRHAAAASAPPFEVLLARSRRRRVVLGGGCVVLVVAAVVSAIAIPNALAGRRGASQVAAGALVTSGRCAGLRLVMSVAGEEHVVEPAPADNDIAMRVGDALTYTASGPCASQLAFSTVSSTSDSMAALRLVGVASASPGPSVSTGSAVVTGPGSAVIDVVLRTCPSGADCPLPPALATLAITVSDATPPSPSGPAAVTVTPATGLVDGENVHVQVNGFPAEAKVWLSECADVSQVNPWGCGVGLPEQPFLITDDNGVAAGTFAVTSVATGSAESSAPATPCASNCVLAAVSGVVAGKPPRPIASAPLSFQPS